MVLFEKDYKEIEKMLRAIKHRAIFDNRQDIIEFIDKLLHMCELVKYYDLTSIHYFSDHHLRQSASFLMNLADVYGSDKHQMPEYFEDEFFEILDRYPAIRNRFMERMKKAGDE